MSIFYEIEFAKYILLIELELWLGAGGADGEPGAVREAVLEQVRRQQAGNTSIIRG